MSGVNTSTFGYRTRPKPPVPGQIRRPVVADSIGRLHEESRGSYGYRRVEAAPPREPALTFNHGLVTPIIAELGSLGLLRVKTWKRNMIGARSSSDLVKRSLTVDRPNQLPVTDVTEHLTQEGTCLRLRRIRRDSPQSRRSGGLFWPATSLVNSASFMAYSSSQPAASRITHAVHGAQFTSWAFPHRVEHYGLRLSLGTVGGVTMP